MDIDDPIDRARTDAAETHFIAREHDAVHFGPVKAFRLVSGTLEGADLPEVLLRGQKVRRPAQLPLEERVHAAVRLVRLANLAAFGLVLHGVGLVRLFVPWSR